MVHPTTMITLSSCIGDSCGWIAAIVALFAAGTYGVPIKETMYQITDLNPFVFQTYKVVIFFVISVTTVLVFHVPIRMTFVYGTLSGLLWVCGGTGGIVAVRYAGLATAVGTWASIMICINFTWGILVFNEPVVNLYNTVAAFLLLMLGLIGMSTYGDPSNNKSTTKSAVASSSTNNINVTMGDPIDSHGSNKDADSGTYKKETDPRTVPCRKVPLNLSGTSMSRIHRIFNNNNNYNSDDEYELEDSSENAITSTLLKQRKVVPSKESFNDEESAESDTLASTASLTTTNSSMSNNSTNLSTNVSQLLVLNYNPETHVRLFNSQIVVTKRTAGIMAALFNGFMSGSSLIPMHYAKRQPNGNWGGLNYLISFSVGSLFSCFTIWFIYYMILILRQYRINQRSTLSNLSSNSTNTSGSSSNSGITDDMVTSTTTKSCNIFYQAASKMPDAYFKVLWKSGLAAGSLNAIGMIGSVLAVTYLGQGVGNSVIQCKIIVSGMWGIFYYKEIDSPSAIRKWFVSASLSVIGIIWLSRERINATAQSST